jgi:peptide/nickel transport system substrate-binding protein
MRHLRWQALIALLGLVLVGGLLMNQERGGVVEVISGPLPGGVYTEALVGAPAHINPLLDFANPVDRDLSRLLFSGLTRFDTSGLPIPDLANWNVSDDQKTYTFILKPTLTWHDGQPLTAQDVAFTIGLLQDPAYPGPADVAELWRSVTVKVVNTQTVELTLPEPFAPFLDYTAIGLLPQHALRGVSAAQLSTAAFNLNPIGSGPFKVERWLRTASGVTSLLLSAFPGYPGDAPLLPQVQFNFYADGDAAFAAYEKGEVMGLGQLSEKQLAAALKMPQLGVYTALRPAYSLIFLNLQSDVLPFFKEKKVRQALLMSLNRETMVSAVLNGQAMVATSPILPSSWAYNVGLTAVKYDPPAAASLLDNAGWVLPADAVPGTDTYVRQKGGTPLTFTLTTPNDPVHVALANMAQATWAQVGVKVTINPVDPTRLRADYLEPRPRVFDAILADFDLSGTPDPDPYPLWHETQIESGQNYGGLNDRAISQYLEQARITTDVTVRAQLYRSFQSRFADQVPALLLYYPVYNYAVDTKVGGVQVGFLSEPRDRFNTLAQWYLLTRRTMVEQPAATATP